MSDELSARIDELVATPRRLESLGRERTTIGGIGPVRCRAAARRTRQLGYRRWVVLLGCIDPRGASASDLTGQDRPFGSESGRVDLARV